MEKAAAAILAEINKQKQTKAPMLVAIDGRCAAGKSTIAGIIQRAAGCTVIHMDDFFLRPEQRTKERLLMPGGNIDWERFIQEVLLPLSSGQAAFYRPYDCHSQKFAETVKADLTPFILIEGSYSCHPWLWDFYAFHVFLNISHEEQLRRIKARSGTAFDMFRDKWIPLEERYFEAFDIAKRCELRLETSGLR